MRTLVLILCQRISRYNENISPDSKPVTVFCYWRKQEHIIHGIEEEREWGTGGRLENKPFAEISM